MVEITLVNGNKLHLKSGVTVLEVAQEISEGLARQAVAGKISYSNNDDNSNDNIITELVDLQTPLTNNSTVQIITSKDKESYEILNHTTAHVFAQAVLRLYPKAKITIGPPIENGFWYDVDCDELTDDTLSHIEEEMRKIITENVEISKEYMTIDDAKEFFKNNEYKLEIIEGIINKTLKEEESQEGGLNGELLQFYSQGEFKDLCKGPHLPRTGLIKAFKLEKVTKAYWRGNADNKQLNRVYGAAFWKKSEMDAYYEMLEEAKKRDHRIIGKQLNLYSISQRAPGMPFFHHKGMIIWNELENYWKEIHQRDNYELIKTPIMLDRTLWETSGHWFNYKENMYTSNIDDKEYAIKPMNCPGGILVYKANSYSYKDLPIRSGEIGLVHRHELSGALTGLFRVRCFHQDDAHIFMREEQIKEEILGVLNLIDEIYGVMGLTYHLELSTRPEKSIGTDEAWEISTKGLKDALDSCGKKYKLNPGDGAFYGPKIDVHLRDSIGRTHQCGTIQLDMNLPQRFDMHYTDENNQKIRPVMIHRVIYGSFERFFAILVEHFAGKFPLWLSPNQVKIIPVAHRHIEKCQSIKQELLNNTFRVEMADEAQTVSNKIRQAYDDKFNYMIIIGDEDIKHNTITVRDRYNTTHTYKTLQEFIDILVDERESKRILKESE